MTDNDYGLDLNKIKSNFKRYRNPAIPKDDEEYDAPQPKAKEAQDYKTDYTNNVKKFMTIGAGTPKNTVNTTDNDIGQDVGNKGDWNNNVSDIYGNISNSNIGNDYSVNIGGVGTGGAGSTGGLSNMQSAAAYTALNNNQARRSDSELSGSSRAAKASMQADSLVGSRDRSANLYNSMGYSQNYWRRKAEAQQNFYLGDIYSMKAPEFETPASPADPFDKDKTGKMYKDGMNAIKDS